MLRYTRWEDWQLPIVSRVFKKQHVGLLCEDFCTIVYKSSQLCMPTTHPQSQTSLLQQLMSLRHTFSEKKDMNYRTDDEIYEDEVDEETKLRHKIDEVNIFTIIAHFVK